MIERVIRGAEVKNSRLVARHTHGHGPRSYFGRNRGRTAYQKDQRDENYGKQPAKREERFIRHTDLLSKRVILLFNYNLFNKKSQHILKNFYFIFINLNQIGVC
jgi:hypothetical protein